MPALPQTKLFSVDMPQGSLCDCGQKAETQFVLTTGVKEAKRLASEAKKARAAGCQASDVCCGVCIAKRVAEKGLFVTEVLKHSPIKWERVTDDLVCEDCGKSLPFGSHAHFHAESHRAICGDCGVRRGWTDATLASLEVQLAEKKADIITCRKRFKVEVEGLYILREKIDVYKLADSYAILEGKITGAMALLASYLNAVATTQEKSILDRLEEEIYALQDLAKKINEELRVRLFVLEKAERQRQMAMKVFETADAAVEEELEQARLAAGAHSEVPKR